jgi:hypothetical protein
MERFRQLQEKTSLPAPVEAGRGGAIAAQSDPEPFMGSHSKVWPHGTRETMQRSPGLFVILRPFGRWLNHGASDQPVGPISARQHTPIKGGIHPTSGLAAMTMHATAPYTAKAAPSGRLSGQPWRTVSADSR